MKLLVCEKPSVAQTVAKVIGVGKRCDGYLEGGGYLVSWCMGHLVELARPESYGERYARWRKEDLPILPEQWKYQVSAAKKQFDILKKLMQRPDVTGLICGTDGGKMAPDGVRHSNFLPDGEGDALPFCDCVRFCLWYLRQYVGMSGSSKR